MTSRQDWPSSKLREASDMDSAKKRAPTIVRLGVLILLGPWLHSSVSTAADRFSLSGEGTLSIEPPAQTSERLRLAASLSPMAVAPAMHADGRFALTGVLTAASLVCYNDTIFRDDFDGDGL